MWCQNGTLVSTSHQASHTSAATVRLLLLGSALVAMWAIIDGLFMSKTKADRARHRGRNSRPKKPKSSGGSNKIEHKLSGSAKRRLQTIAVEIKERRRSSLSSFVPRRASGNSSSLRKGSLGRRRSSLLASVHGDTSLTYRVILSSLSRFQREEHERRVLEDAAALEGGGTHAHFGAMRVRACGRNPERVLGWVALCYELPSFVSLCFLPVGAFAASYFDFIQDAWVAVSSTLEWNDEAWVIGTAAAFGALLITTLSVDRFRSADHPLLRVLVFDILLIRIVTRGASLLTCSYSPAVCTETLDSIAGLVCWEGRHWAYAAVGVLLLAGEYFAALRHALVTRNQRRPAFRFSIRFNVLFVMGKVLVTTACALLRHAAAAALGVVLASMVGLLIANAMMAPCRGRGKHANNLRAATFSLAAWAAMCGLLSLLDADVATAVFLGGFSAVAVLAWYLNNRYSASKVSIPELSLKMLLNHHEPYVQEFKTTNGAVRARQWASQTVLRHHAPPEADLNLNPARTQSGMVTDVKPSKMPSYGNIARSLTTSKVLPVIGVDVASRGAHEGAGERNEETQRLSIEAGTRMTRDARAFLESVLRDRSADPTPRARAARTLYRYSDRNALGSQCWLEASVRCLAPEPCVGPGVLESAIAVRETLALLSAKKSSEAPHISLSTLSGYFTEVAHCYCAPTVPSEARAANIQPDWLVHPADAPHADAVAALLESCTILWQMCSLFRGEAAHSELEDLVANLIEDHAVYSSCWPVAKHAEALFRLATQELATDLFEPQRKALKLLDQTRSKVSVYYAVAFGENEESESRRKRNKKKIKDIMTKLIKKAAIADDAAAAVAAAYPAIHHVRALGAGNSFLQELQEHLVAAARTERLAVGAGRAFLT